MSNPATAIVTMEQRMTLFRHAMRVVEDGPDTLGLDKSRRVIEVFNGFLEAIVKGLPLPLSGDELNRSPLDEFLAERCERGEGLRVQASTLYAAFLDWSAVAYPDNSAPSATSFGTEMSARCAKKYSNVVHYLGLRLKTVSVNRCHLNP